jgi:alkanesulfonate monooxygenase SsuD/methylene tetrahydromethanopterin reductase-like flavin-dependent oxidoreductase (luciferase family)
MTDSDVKDTDIAFGLVLTPSGTGNQWAERIRAAEQQGWTSVLVPDTLWTVSPFPALAAAAAVTSDIRLRTWVLAAPLRSPAVVARETAALQALSDGRFELGIGTGRPDAEREAGQLGVPWGSAADRREQVIRVAAEVRAKVNPAPPVVMAAVGPRMLELAGSTADRIALALPPLADGRELTAAVERVQAVATRPVGLSQQLSGMSGQLPEWLRHNGPTADEMIEHRAVGMLMGDADEVAATLLRRHANLGIDEYIVPGDLAELFAPVIAAVRAH